MKEVGGMKKKKHDYESSGTISKLPFLKHSWHEIGLIGRNKVA